MNSIVTSDIPQPWDVVVVPFPYSEQLAEKRRPALVVSNASLAAMGFLWVAMITSARRSMREGDFPVTNLIAAKLPGPSLIRTSKIATVEPRRVLRVLGRVADAERVSVSRSIAAFLAAAV